MGREQLRETCRSYGGSVWSLVIQMLQFAAREYPEEFRRRRDGIAEALFSPELSGSRPSDRQEAQAGGSEAEWEPYLPSSWQTMATASTATQSCLRGSSEVTPPGTQASLAGDDEVLLGDARGPRRVRVTDSYSAEAPSLAQSAEGEGERGPRRCQEAIPRPLSPPGNQSPLGFHERHKSQAAPPPQPGNEPVAARGSRQGAGSFAELRHAYCSARNSVEDRSRHGREGADHGLRPWGGRGPETRNLAQEKRQHLEQSEVEAHGVEEGEGREQEADEDEGGRGLGKQGEEHEETAEGDDEDVDVDLELDGADELSSDELVKMQLESAKAFFARQDVAAHDVLQRLRELHHLPVSLDVLMATQMGKVVRGLGRQFRDRDIERASKELIRGWKSLVSQQQQDDRGAAGQPGTAAVADAPPPGDAATGHMEGSWLPAPPLEDSALEMGALELSNCLTDLDSIGSELSGSVGSAGAVPCLATKTPESQRNLAPSESSPCETNRPSAYPAGAGASAAGAGAAPARQSVLSSSVRKTEWGWTECGADLAPQEDEEEQIGHPGGAHLVGGSQRGGQERALAAGAVKSALPAQAGGPAMKPVPRRPAPQRPAPQRPALEKPAPERPAPVSRQQQARIQGAGQQGMQGPGRGTAQGASVKGGEAEGQPPRAAPARPAMPMNPDSCEQERLDNLKKRLQQKYSQLDAVKKAKTVQVVEAAPMSVKPKSGFKQGSLGQKLGRFAHRY